MDADRLRGFLVVARFGAISKAAERIGISQPALSRQIQQLEHEVGAPLFERTGRGVRLTAAGERLASRARPLLRALTGLLDELRAESGELSGTVALGLPPSFPPRLAADLLERAKATHPGLRVRLTAALTGALHSGLLDGTFDLAVVHAPVAGPHLETSPLWSERIVAIAPSSWRLPAALTLEAALSRPVLLPSPNQNLRQIVAAAALSRNLELRVSVEIDSLRFLVHGIQAGLGLSFLPRRAVLAELAAGEVSAHALSDLHLERHALLARVALANEGTLALHGMLLSLAREHHDAHRRDRNF
ncbi:MAG: LysR family transcriptional regulator [Myxococcales bacterium]|nr:LysR family transcriptional regulator [Myxococcales bacterium]